MDLPQLPTDNLYKFMALAGVALLLFGLTYPLHLASKISLELADASAQVEIAQLRTDRLSERFEALRANPNAAAVESMVLETQLHELREQAAVLNGKASRFRVLLAQFIFFTVVCLVSAVGGYILAREGFKLWYIRVQKPADLKAASDGT